MVYTQCPSSESHIKDHIYQVLMGEIEIAGEQEQSALSALAATPPASLTSPLQRLIVGAAFACLGAFIILLAPLVGVMPDLRIAGTACIILPLLHGCVRALKAHAGIRRAVRDLEPSIGELRDVQRLLEDYLVDLDRRTSRYFHCVTNTKIMAYCVLRQIQMAVQDRVTDIEARLRRPTAFQVSVAHELMQTPLTFRDGFARDAGREYQSTLTRLRPLVAEIIGDLNQSLNLFEEDIAILHDEARRES